MKTIKVLGVGCAKCKQTEAQVRRAIETYGLDAQVERVEEMEAILAYGVMVTPALVVDERVVQSGGIPSLEDVKKYLS